MKKFLRFFAICLVFSAINANAATLEQKIEKIEAKYEQRIKKLNNSRYTEERKAILKQHATQNKDLKIKQVKELALLKTSPKAKTKKK